MRTGGEVRERPASTGCLAKEENAAEMLSDVCQQEAVENLIDVR
jgi:hypothetical protein